MKDMLLKGMLCDATVNFYAISAPEMAESVRRLHGTSPVCTAALGRTLMAASMMGAMMKIEEGEVSLIVKGGGPAGNIVCVGRADGSVKGYITNPQVDLPPRESDGKLDVSGAVGKNGTLTVINDLGMKEPYIGQSDLVSGEIAEDVASHFLTSQQQPSAVFLGVHLNAQGVTSACGLILQPMPNCPDPILDLLESRLYAVKEMPDLLAGGMELKEVIDWMLSDTEPQYTMELTPVFRCDCSRERLEQVLISLGEKELSDMADQQHGAEMTCHFCNQVYRFDEEELRALALRAEQAKTTRGEMDDGE